MPLNQNAHPTSGFAQLFFSLGFTVLLGFIVYIGRGVLIPFVIAGFVCFLIFSLKESVAKTPMIGTYFPHWLSYLFAFAIISLCFVIIVAIVRTNVSNVLEVWPDYERRLTSFASNIFKWFRAQDYIPQELIGSMADLQQAALGMVTPLLRQALGSLGSITSNFLTLGTVLFYVSFMLLERGRIFKKIGMISAGKNQQQAVNETISDIAILVRQYISVKTITNLITATISYVIMKFIGVDFAGFWALLIFLFNFIPLFGAAMAILMPVSLMLVQPDGGPLKALILFGFMIGAEQTMSAIIEPRLVGRTLNLSPLVILFSLAVWGALWGFTGVLLSIPMTITVMLILTQFQSTRPIAILLSDNGEIADIKHENVMLAGLKDETEKETTETLDSVEPDTDISETKRPKTIKPGANNADTNDNVPSEKKDP